MLKPIARWNTRRDCWERSLRKADHFVRWVVFSETWPTSGTMRNGEAYELPTWEPRTSVTEFSSSPVDEDSLLRTPCAQEAGGGPLSPAMAKLRKQTLRLTGQIIDHFHPDQLEKPEVLFQTPSVADGMGGRRTRGGDRSNELLLNGQVQELKLLSTPRSADGMTHVLRENVKNPRGRLEDEISLLPAPRATDGTKGGPNQRGSSGDLMLPSAVHRLLPTPTAMDSKASGGAVGSSNVTLTDATVRQPSEWGKYAPAIERWEKTLGRPAPEPTEPSPFKTGRFRLAAPFVEWMMGLPKGWVTGIDIKRNDQLKALGNGVVPQQAFAALTDMLDTYRDEILTEITQ